MYNTKVKTTRKLNIKDWSGYFFKEMVNILDIEPEYFIINDFNGCKDGSVLFNIAYCGENSVPHVVFNDIECILRKSRIYSYLVFCESEKNKKVIDYYLEIINQVKEELLSRADEDYCVMGKDFMRFRFRTDDNLVHNKKINYPVCVISLSCTVKKEIFIIHSLNYKIVCMKLVIC